MSFSVGKTLDYYLSGGWMVASPLKGVCPQCSTALLQHPDYPFTYCIDCAKTVQVQDQDTRQTGAEAPEVPETPETAHWKPTSPPGKTPTALLGDYLLRGYIMSSLACPNGCNVPLLRDPTDPRLVLCVVCEFRSSCTKFTEPQSMIDSEEIARQIVQKVGLIASCQTRADPAEETTQLMAPPEPFVASECNSSFTKPIVKALESKLLELGEQLAAVEINKPLGEDTQHYISSLVTAIKDISNARSIFLHDMAASE